MSITDQGVYKELLLLAKSTPRKVNWRLEGNLYVTGQRVTVANVVQHINDCDFATRFYGDQFITIQVDPVVYRHVVNYKNMLTFEVVKLQQDGKGQDSGGEVKKSQRFKAHLLNSHDPAMIAALGKGERKDGTVVQASRLIDVHLQLEDNFLNDYRLRDVGGVYPNITMYKLIKFLMGHTLGETVDVPTVSEPEYLGLRGVDIIDCDNTKVYDQIVIPAGIRLYQLPDFLQKEYGVYNTGMGWHYYRGWCFIYPLLNYQLHPVREKTMTVVNIPQTEIPALEKSYLYRSDHLYVFATGDSGNIDTTEHMQQNQGVGQRFVNADKLLDSFVTTDSNITTVNRKTNERKFVIENRGDGTPNVRMAKERFTNNPFKIASVFAQSMGTTVVLQWDRSSPELLYPGMPVDFMFKDGETMTTLKATLMGMKTITSPATTMATDKHFISTTTLTLFVKRRDL